MGKSAFVELFEDTKTVNVIDFLLENRVFEYSREDIKEALGYPVTVVTTIVKKLKRLDMVIILYESIKLNTDSRIVIELVRLDNALTRQRADDTKNKG